MDAPEARVDHFAQDCADYHAMYQLSLEQRDYIAREDLEGLGSTFQRMHRLMDRVRLRQLGRPVPGGTVEELRQGEELRRLITEIEELRRGNEEAVQGLLEQTRGKLRLSQQGRRSLRGYQSIKPSDARFIDRVR